RRVADRGGRAGQRRGRRGRAGAVARHRRHHLAGRAVPPGAVRRRAAPWPGPPRVPAGPPPPPGGPRRSRPPPPPPPPPAPPTPLPRQAAPPLVAAPGLHVFIRPATAADIELYPPPAGLAALLQNVTKLLAPALTAVAAMGGDPTRIAIGGLVGAAGRGLAVA